MSTGNLFSELNDKQLAAVKAPRRPVLVIAGPGTGKTRTLIARIMYEVDVYKIAPDQVVALTFSNKAAGEIRGRLAIGMPAAAEKITVSTLHAFCLSLLRKNYRAAGLDKHVSVCDDTYQKKLLISLIKPRPNEQPENMARGIQLAISNHLLNERELPPYSASVYENYLSHLKKHKLIDYNQILTLTRALLRNHPDILSQYQFQYQSILVDEFQDTDRVQYQILKMMAEKKRNIFVVADDDQSIYAWRGANPANIREFIQDFKISEPVFLDKNYRSGPQIAEIAQLILQDTDRIEPGKKIITERKKNDLIRVMLFSEEDEEQSFIMKTIHTWHREENVPLSKIAIIYPRHIFGDRITHGLFKERIPYQLTAGKNLTDNPFMKKLMLYLRLIHDPSDSLILEELLDAELGYHVFKQIQNYQISRNLTFRKALNEYALRNEISIDLRLRLRTFIGNIANLVNLKTFYRFNGLIDQIAGSMEELNRSVLRHNVKRLEDIDIRIPPKCRKPAVKIWLYHADEKILFLAVEMARKVLGSNVHALRKDAVIHVSATDIVIQLDDSPAMHTPALHESISHLGTSRRRGSLSVFYRWLQACQVQHGESVFRNYVVFDLETTGRDPANCGIVEIAAVRVRDGHIADTFKTLINPGIPISPEAEAVHHISNSDIDDAPGIDAVWHEFRDFVGNDLLLAHNGYAFDFRIIDRMARELEEPRVSTVRYDSLILARILFPEASNSIDALADRFHLDTGTRHRALDDVIVLHEIFQHLLKIMQAAELKTVREDLTEYVALGNFIQQQITETEDRIYLLAGIPRLLSPYSSILKEFIAGYKMPTLQHELQHYALSLSGDTMQYDSHKEFLHRIMDMARDFNHMDIDDAIAEFLTYIALLNPQDNLEDIEAVSLLTFHAVKGLEFDRVIILGLEDENMPSMFAYRRDSDDDRPVRKKMEEQKRLLYVGITRAKEEVILSAVKNRFGRQQRSSPFLKEIRQRIEREGLFVNGSTI